MYTFSNLGFNKSRIRTYNTEQIASLKNKQQIFEGHVRLFSFNSKFASTIFLSVIMNVQSNILYNMK